MRSPTAIASAPPEPPSPVTVTMTGTGQPRHFAHIVRDGFGLAALLGVDARIGALRIHENEHGPAKLCRELHRAHRFAISFRLGLAEISRDALLGVASFLVADDHHGLAVKPRHAGDDGRIVRKTAVAVNLAEIFEKQADEIVRVGPLRMARELHALPGLQMRVEFLLQLVHFAANALDFTAPSAVGRIGKLAELRHVAFERIDRCCRWRPFRSSASALDRISSRRHGCFGFSVCAAAARFLRAVRASRCLALQQTLQSLARAAFRARSRCPSSLHHRHGIRAADFAHAFHKFLIGLHRARALRASLPAIVCHKFECHAAAARAAGEKIREAGPSRHYPPSSDPAAREVGSAAVSAT